MKYVILLGDGMAGYPIEQLAGRTTLEASHTPNMDRIARQGTIGLIDTIPEGFTPGSDVANLAVLGYDPTLCHSGRGPLEAASIGIQLEPDDVAFRCNLVTMSGGETPVMEDFTADHISSNEARIIVADLNRETGSSAWTFYPGVDYRHLMVWKAGPSSLKTTPPHDIVGQTTDDFLPEGDGAGDIRELMRRSQVLLREHPVNRARIERGRKPATSIWLWGQGGPPHMIPLTETYNIRGGVISAVDLLKGIGVYAGLEPLAVAGATGYTDTNYRGKAEKALEYLEDHDFIFLHVEAPDEMGHEGDRQGKIMAIEDFDRYVVGTMMEGLHGLGDYRLMVLSDHPTPIDVRTHVSDPSPFAVISSIDGENIESGSSFAERNAKRSGIMVSPGHTMMEYFITDWRAFIDKQHR